MKFIKSEIIGCGFYLPEKILSNDDLSKMVETNDEWIFTRTGIKSRHIAGDDEYSSDLACFAAQDALADSKLSKNDIDCVIAATITPDNTTPSTACIVCKKLGIKYGVPAFDISAACSGFVYALTVADSLIKNRIAKNILVIGVETLSRIVDWSDRNTCVLFGDGAGAVVVSGKETDNQSDSGIISSAIFADSSSYDDLYTNGGVSTTKSAGFIQMNGKEVFKKAVHCLSEGVVEALKKADMKVSDIDWLLPHQANSRIIEATGKMLEIPEEKVILAISDVGNTSAASIPIAFALNIRSGRIKKGDIIAMTSMGAGFTWGAVLLKF